ncbi:MAG: hypothetical protein HBSIN02_10390 [Bacteroidia bacterium]|nr:MAG: hypothetical protein HBSIN02_10390 [Bacteroidia bacterium]
MISPKTRTFVFLLVSFLLGGVAGGFLGATYFGGKPGRYSRGDVMKEFTEKLKLRAEQTVAVDSILEAHKSKFSAIRKQYGEATKAQRDSLRKDIRKILSDEQHALFDTYIREMDERESRYRRQNR